VTVKKKTLYGVLAVTLIFVLVAGMSWWQFGKSLVDKGELATSSSHSLSNSHNDADIGLEPPVQQDTVVSDKGTLSPDEQTEAILGLYEIDFSDVKEPLDLLENEQFMEQMKKAGLSEDEIKKELDYLQEQYDKEG
jgi:hypothetical protein